MDLYYLDIILNGNYLYLNYNYKKFYILSVEINDILIIYRLVLHYLFIN